MKIPLSCLAILSLLASTVQPMGDPQKQDPALVWAFIGHSSSVTSVAFSPDGRIALTGSADNTLKLWDVTKGVKLQTLNGHSDVVRSVVFSPDGRYVLSGSDDKTLKLWETYNGIEIRTFEGHSHYVTSVVYSPDGRHILSGSRDQKLKLWEVSTGVGIRTFKGASNMVNSVALSPDGRYALSGDAYHNIQLWDVSPWTEGAEEPQSIADNTLPIIQIHEPAVSRGMKKVLQEKTVLVKGKATDKSGIFEVLNNNQEAGLDAQGNFWAEVKLRVGENRITVQATDTHENSASTAFTVVRETEGAPEPDVAGGDNLIKGQYYALIIGIDSYSGEWDRLRNAVHDARGVKDVLEFQYRFDHFITLYDQDATRANIITKLEWLADNLNEDDNLLVYYSGHGELDERLNRGFWVPVDAKTRSVAHYIPNSLIQTFLGGIRSQHTLLVSDACFSGDIFRGRASSLSPADFPDMDRYYRETYKRPSRQAITSGGIEPVVDRGRDGHSVFTYYFLKALRENQERYYDAGQLYERLKIPVANNSDQTPICQAIKDTGDEGGQFIFMRKQ